LRICYSELFPIMYQRDVCEQDTDPNCCGSLLEFPVYVWTCSRLSAIRNLRFKGTFYK
jgi:hypothetical protein